MYGLTKTLRTVEKETSGDKISFADLLRALEKRGFGPMLIVPSMIVVLPTGAIPGVPTLSASLIILIAAQIAWGRKVPWVPERLKRVSFDRGRFRRAIRKIRPYTEWVDSFFHPRLEFLTKDIAQRVIAVICCFLALSMIAFEVVPFAAMLPALSILMFGLSLSAYDGLFTVVGGAFMFSTFFAIFSGLM